MLWLILGPGGTSWHHPMQKEFFWEYYAQLCCSISSFGIKLHLGCKQPSAKLSAREGRRGGTYPARVPGVQTHRCFQPRLPSSSLGHPAVAPATDHTTLQVLISRKRSLSWQWKYSAFTFTALHRFLQSVPRQVQALSSTSHTFLLKTRTHTSPHIRSGHTQITILSFLRSLKETLSC